MTAVDVVRTRQAEANRRYRDRRRGGPPRPAPGTFEERFLARVVPEPTSGCWLWDGPLDPDGYGHLAYGARGRMGAHRASWIIHAGPIPPSRWVLHKCDVPSCVNPRHLYLGTQVDNWRDCVARGRYPFRRGSRHYLAKLDETSAAAIYRDPRPGLVIARAYRISPMMVSDIKLRKTWRHIHG